MDNEFLRMINEVKFCNRSIRFTLFFSELLFYLKSDKLSLIRKHDFSSNVISLRSCR